MKFPAIILVLGIAATVVLTHVPMSVFGGHYQRSFVLFPHVEQSVHHGQVIHRVEGIHFTSNDVAHFGMYACIGLVAWAVVRPRYRKTHGWCLILLAGMAALDEFTQGFFQRQPELADWMLDCVGILSGWIFALVFIRPWLLLTHGRMRRMPALSHRERA